MIDLSHARWRKSKRSGTGDNCVETAGLPGVVAVRDSKSPSSPALLLSQAEWRAFASEVKAGRFDF